MFDYDLFQRRLSRNSCQNTAFVKAEVGERLHHRLSFLKLEPAVIYLEGFFTEQQKKQLQQWYPQATLTHVLSPGIDLIVSHAKLQQCQNLFEVLAQWWQCLKVNGTLLFSVIGGDSLRELRDAWQDGFVHVNQMLDFKTVGDALQASLLDHPVVDRETMHFSYQSLDRLIADVRELGEPLADTKMNKGFTTRTAWQAFSQQMQAADYVMTYEAIYGYAIKAQAQPTSGMQNNEATIDLAVLRKSLQSSS